ncbi:zinc-binding dehydrogenase [Rhodococcus sp. NPDC060090]|uniref:zinc-binding dehydrogenase n=1 Tax=unclassified Rhodococcus (in: high G+C Gram-positive bacteria) TaxID=192944 RepID=UPI00105082DA|nr:zinc-binding dehydrogenase [Rhodococcus sp. SMB37]
MLTTAKPDTARELGRAPVQPTDESLEKITEVIGYGLVDPTVTARYGLDDTARAIAAVEEGHTVGTLVVEP